MDNTKFTREVPNSVRSVRVKDIRGRWPANVVQGCNIPSDSPQEFESGKGDDSRCSGGGTIAKRVTSRLRSSAIGAADPKKMEVCGTVPTTVLLQPRDVLYFRDSTFCALGVQGSGEDMCSLFFDHLQIFFRSV